MLPGLIQKELYSGSGCYDRAVEVGTFSGIEGVIFSSVGKGYLVISITLLHRSVAIQMDERRLFSVIEPRIVEKAVLCNEENLALTLSNRQGNRIELQRFQLDEC
jgi:hypothetical protein